MSTSPPYFISSFPAKGPSAVEATGSSPASQPTHLEFSSSAPCAVGTIDSLIDSKPRPRKASTSRGARGRYGCRTCRQRHLKCDEHRPICENCTRAKRECSWNHEIRMSHDARSSSFSASQGPARDFHADNPVEGTTTTDFLGRKRWLRWMSGSCDWSSVRRDESGDYISNLPEREDLSHGDVLVHPLEASLFRFYIEHAGPWLDITSPSRHFGVTIPRLAISNPVLLYACLSYSSKALLPKSSLSEQYMNACIKLLIPLLSDELYVSSDETLLATLVILRHVEQYAEVPEDRGAHLMGAFSLIASQKLLPPHDSLPGAALWTYMRQDVRQALLNRASPKLTPSQGIHLDNFDVDVAVGESVWADRACHLAALACTFAWGSKEEEVDGDHLDAMLDRWRQHLPREYLPFHVAGRSIQFLASWHVVGWQFYHLGKLLLRLYNSQRPRNMDILLFNSRVETEISEHARAIFDITRSNSDLGCRFNASAILGFVGSYFREAEDRQRLIDFLGDFSNETNWPTDTDRTRLLRLWQSRH